MKHVRLKRIGLVVASLLALACAALQYERTREIDVPILMYHKLGDAKSDVWSVHHELFEQHMKFLIEAGYTSILPDDLVAHKRWGVSLPPKPVIITFDGGYQSALTIAEPVLEELGLRGICYLQTEYIAERQEDRKRRSKSLTLTWGEVQAMQERGTMTFGGLGHNNRNLALGDPADEMRQCFDALQAHVGFAPTAFAYPHGQYREHTIAAARSAGFTSAMEISDEVERTGRGMHVYALRRVAMTGGLHHFSGERIGDGEAGHVTFRFVHEGIPLKVVPRLVADSLQAADTWLAPTKLRKTAEWRWAVEPHVAKDASLRVELWDDDRVIRLYPPAS